MDLMWTIPKYALYLIGEHDNANNILISTFFYDVHIFIHSINDIESNYSQQNVSNVIPWNYYI